MGTEDTTDLMEDEGGGDVPIATTPSAAVVTCSICFEAVADSGARSWAKLQCDHKFHLDCIGSAFNVKGMMQCPNCRKIEKGQWLYANGCRSGPDFSIDDWPHEEDIYDLGFSDVPFGFQWCPFGGLTRLPSSFEGRELPSAAYHDLLGHHTLVADHTAASSVAHSCPYFTYYQPPQSTSSNTNEGIVDDPSFRPHWGLSGPSEISTSHNFPSADLQYHTWDHSAHSFSVATHIGGAADQALVSSATLRSSRGDSDAQSRSGSFAHPVLMSHGSVPRAGSSVISPAAPRYPGSNSRSHDRPLGHSYQQQQPSAPSIRLPVFSTSRRLSGPRAPIGPVTSSPERTGGFYVLPSSGSSVRTLQQADNSLRSHFYAWERDRFAPFPLVPVDRESSWWLSFHQAQAASALDSNNRSSSIWQGHGSDRASLSRTESPPYSQTSHPIGSLHPFI